jgi:hypothetical protein
MIDDGVELAASDLEDRYAGCKGLKLCDPAKLRALLADKLRGMERCFTEWRHIAGRDALKAVDRHGSTLAKVTGQEIFRATWEPCDHDH